jgi:hypothetical protein
MRYLIVFVLIGMCPATVAWGEERQWQAGVARVNITPELPIWLSGYAARTQPAQDKLDDLWAKALAIEDATGRRAVLVTMDLVGIDRELSREVCRGIEGRFQLPRAAIALCASHTHSGPVVGTNLAPMYSLDDRQAARVELYAAKLADHLVDVVGRSVEALKPARLSFGKGKATFAVNRRNNPEPDVLRRRQENSLVGPVDHDVPVLVVQDENANLQAIVCGYACHATVLDGYAVSGDWPGEAQNELERRRPGTIALFWAGCGADQNPLPRRNVEFVKQYGRQLADAVDATLQSELKPLEPKLNVDYEEIELLFATLPTREQLESYAISKPPHTFWAKYLLAAWDHDGGLPSSYAYPVQSWKLGAELQWLFLGGEVVVDYSLQLKSKLGADRTWVASYANDVMGYVPSQRVLREGGYEGGESRYYYGLPAVWGDDIEQKIVDAVQQLSTRP